VAGERSSVGQSVPAAGDLQGVDGDGCQCGEGLGFGSVAEVGDLRGDRWVGDGGVQSLEEERHFAGEVVLRHVDRLPAWSL